MVFKSKQILTATLIVALGAALAVNWYYRNTPELSEETTTIVEEVSGNLGDSLYVGGTTSATTDSAESKTDVKSYFSDAKLKRTQTQDKIIENIKKIAETTELDSDTKNRLSVLISDYQAQLKSETDCENLITAKTSKECLVIINDGTCQVILEKNTLNDLLILQITEIIEKNTEISSENLTIIELK